MRVKTSGETTQSRNNSSCRCAHTGVIFSPPHHGMPTGGCSLEAIDTTRGYVTQTGVKEEDTVGIVDNKPSVTHNSRERYKTMRQAGSSLWRRLIGAGVPQLNA